MKDENTGGRSRRAGNVALAALSLTAIALFSATEASAKCSVQGRFRISSEGPWPFSLHIRSGDSCEKTFRSFGTMMFKRLYLVTAPRQGTITLRSGGYYRYMSKAGAQGQDAFTLRVCGEASGRESCANLAYNVTIQ